MCVRRAGGGRRRRLTVAWQPCDIAVLAQELSQPPSGAAPRRRPLLLDKGRRPLAGIGAARRQEALSDVALVLECLEADHGAEGKEMHRRCVAAVEGSLNEGMGDGDAAQVYQAYPLAKALKADADLLALSQEWLAQRPELKVLEQGMPLDSSAGRAQASKAARMGRR